MGKESFIKILRHRAQVRWRKYFPEKRPERLLHDKPWSEMTFWEKRMYGGKDGKPVPIKRMFEEPISHEECERMLDSALKVTLWERIRRNLDL